MLNLSPQPAATWDEPVDMLYACHGKVKRFCGMLKALPAYLAEHGATEEVRQSVRQICTYFNQAAPLHHEDEEQDFFPALLVHAPQSANDIAELERQHIVLHANWTALREQLEALLEGSRNGVDDEVLQRFIAGYDVHTAIEEPLFDLGRASIPQTERQAMGKIMAARRQPKQKAA